MDVGKWLFTEEELLARRGECNSSTKQALAFKGIDYSLTTSEERSILLYYHQKINDICKYFKYEVSTLLTSHLIFSRVHISKPILDVKYDLKHVMLASVFLASKIDEKHTVLSAFSTKIPGTNQQHISELEFILLDWLEYDLMFDLAVEPMTALLVDAFGSLDKAVHIAICNILVSMYMTDLPHLYSSVHLAMAAIKQWSLKTGDQRFDEYIRLLEEKTGQEFSSVIKKIIEFSSSQPTTFDARFLKEIDSKLSECRSKLIAQEQQQ